MYKISSFKVILYTYLFLNIVGVISGSIDSGSTLYGISSCGDNRVVTRVIVGYSIGCYMGFAVRRVNTSLE